MARLPSAKMADALLGGVGRLHGFAIAAERAVVEAAVMVVHRSARLPMTRHTARNALAAYPAESNRAGATCS
jgi:hypothetical protein